MDQTILPINLNNLTDAQQVVLTDLIKSLPKNAEYYLVRNSAPIQEKLKKAQKHVENVNNKDDQATKDRYLAILNEVKDLYLVTDVKDASKVPAVQKSDAAVTEGIINSINASRSIVDNRINNFAAVAAGDFLDTKGIWIDGSFTKGTQKAYKNASGYKFDQKGFTIGADVGDEAMIGLAYSCFLNDIKNKAVSKNKEDITSHLATIYGMFDVTNEIFLKGQGQFGKAYIKKERNTGDLAGNIAKAKTNATISSAKLEAGYNVAIDTNFSLIPTVGISYSNVDIKGYKKTGLGLNRTIGKRTTNRTSGLAGISASYNVEMNSGIKLLPELHANLDYAFSSKNSATTVTIIKGINPISTPSEKLAKIYYNFGGSIKSIHNDKIELTFGYDLGLSKKFQSHTGTAKLRVNL